LEYKPVTDGFTQDLCLVCSNEINDSVTVHLDSIVQTSKCVATNCHCETAFEKKPENKIPKDAKFAYVENQEKNYGNAFDVFFTNTGANTGCSVDACALYEEDCTTTVANGHPVWIEDGNLMVSQDQKRGFASNLCIVCSGQQDIQQTFKISQTDQCHDTLTDLHATYMP